MTAMRWIRFGIVGVVVSCCVAAGQDSTANIINLERARRQAEQRHDTRSLDGMFDSSLIYVDAEANILTKAEFLASVRAPGVHPQILVESMKVTEYRETAVVTGVYRATGFEKGAPYQRHIRFADVWSRETGIWLCISAQSTPILP